VVRVHPDPPTCGAIAQPGEHRLCKPGVGGSNPPGSTIPTPLMMGMAGGAVGSKFRYMVMRIYRAFADSCFLFFVFCFFTCSLTRWKVQCIDAEERWRSSVGRRATENVRQRHGCFTIPNALGLQGQVNKRIRWMPWRPQAMKDVAACEKLRGAGKQALIRRSLNGETHPQGYPF
jgi:hypothetical protein